MSQKAKILIKRAARVGVSFAITGTLSRNVLDFNKKYLMAVLI